MDKFNETVEKAGNCYAGNCHCCEAIVRAVSEHMGQQDNMLFKISTPFGGGMTNNGAACGSLIAAYLCMGAFKGRQTETESRAPACDAADRIFKKFCASYGSWKCRDIVGYDKKDAEATAKYGKKVKDEICIPLTKEVTRWILQELEPQHVEE